MLRHILVNQNRCVPVGKKSAMSNSTMLGKFGGEKSRREIIDLLSQDEEGGEEALDMESSQVLELSQRLSGSQLPNWKEFDDLETKVTVKVAAKPSIAAVGETMKIEAYPEMPTASEPASPLIIEEPNDAFWRQAIQESDKKLKDYEKKRKAEDMEDTSTPSRHKTMPSPRASTKKTATKEPTLQQSSMRKFMQRGTPKARRTLFEDTEEKWYIDVAGERRIIKRGETFEITTDKIFEGFLFTVDGCSTKGLRKQAICWNGACMFMERTFIGSEESTRLIQAPVWCERFQGNPDDANKVRCLRTSVLREGDKIPMFLLNKRYTNKAPDPFLVYDNGPTNKTMSVDFSISFACRSSKAWRTQQSLERKPRILELFAGCGGMSLGLKSAGFDEISYMVERDEFAAATLRSNLPMAEVYEEDAVFFLQRVEDGHPAYPKRNDVDHVHSSSPCQGLSMANRNGGQNDDANNALCLEFVRAVKIFRPRTASFENVTGMLCVSNGNIKYLQKMITDLLLIGYQSRLFIVDASHHGDPQKRERVILFAAPFEQYLPDQPPRHEREPKTIDDVLADLVDVDPVSGSGRVCLANGKVVTQHSTEGNLELRSENDHLSQCDNGFARTVRRQRSVKHHVLERCLTTRERARIQSFPDWYQFCGKPTNQRNQIGNAVPVNLATCLGEALLEAHKKIRVPTGSA
jgi:DNA (cytosine-5)-methyltransferase 1